MVQCEVRHLLVIKLKHTLQLNMAKTKKKSQGFICTPPTKKPLPELYKLKRKITTRGTKSCWMKDSWSPKSKSVASSPTKSPSKQRSSSSHMLNEGPDFDFDQGHIPQPKLPKSLASTGHSYFYYLDLTLSYAGRVRMIISGSGSLSSRTT